MTFDHAGLEPDSRLVDEVYASPNIGPRREGLKPTILILHYTGMKTAAAAIRYLALPSANVSCHYVIDEHGRVTQMVAESMRAWHAGVSHWKGIADVNSASIGIEIHNPGHDHGLPHFPPAQMRAVACLSRDIAGRNGITPEHVLAHSDIAPSRKIDPGETFDWAYLARQGVGHWVRPSPVDADDAGLGLGASGAAVGEMQRLLAAYGYGIEVTGAVDSHTRTVVAAFQRHFRQRRVDGRIDRSTLRTLQRLVAALPKPPSA